MKLNYFAIGLLGHILTSCTTKPEELEACLIEWLDERGSSHLEGVKARQLI